MKKTDFTKRVKELCDYVRTAEHDHMSSELKERGIRDPFTYARWCEHNFELNLREDYKRQTTYTQDFSLAEWCVPIEGMNAIADTLENALNSWRDNVEFFAELIIVFCMKSNEHGARGNWNYSRLYADLYNEVRGLYFDWFDDSHKEHAKAVDYYFDYVD